MARHHHRSKCLFTRYLAETDIVLGVGNHGHSSASEQPRTFAEAQQGFQERGLTLRE